MCEGCKITACQMTFCGQKQCLSGHADICMEKCLDKLKQTKFKKYWKLIIIFVITGILALYPDNSIYVHGNFIMPQQCVNPFFKLFRTLLCSACAWWVGACVRKTLSRPGHFLFFNYFILHMCIAHSNIQ